MLCSAEEFSVQTAEQPIQEVELPEGVPPLTSLYLYIAGACNLACRHCWITPTYRPDGSDGQYIKLEHVHKAVCEAKPLGLHSVKLTGGEPTLHPQFRELVTLIHDEGLDILIETNGTLIDDSLAQFLRDRRVSFISVSVDGAMAETHDYLRGVSGSFERAIDGIKALVRVGFPVQVICTLHQGNVSEIADLVTLAEGLGCRSVKFNLLQRIGRGEKFANDQGLEIGEILELNQYVDSDLVPHSKIAIHLDIPFAFRSISDLLHGDYGRCLVLNILGVLSGGELSLCGIGTSVPELVYGHIETDDLYDVWCYNPGLISLRETVPFKLEGICEQCIHRDICLGSCIANNFHATGKLSAPYNFCDRAEALGFFPASRKK